MGLDSYMYKYPRYKDATASDFNMIENYLDWKKNGQNCTFEEWCGCDEIKIRTDLLDFYKQKNIFVALIGTKTILLLTTPFLLRLHTGEKQMKSIRTLLIMFSMVLMIVELMM